MNEKPERSFHAARQALSALGQTQGLEKALLCVTEALGPMIEYRETGPLAKAKGGIGKLLGITCSRQNATMASIVFRSMP